MAVVREIAMEDAEKYLALCKKLDEETKFRPYDPGERGYGVDEQRQVIADILKGRNSTILLAEVDGELVGYLSASGSSLNRLKHVVRIGVAIRLEYCGRGIGKELFTALEKWAKEKQIHRLELTVMTDNTRALMLYMKMGFELEGVKRHSLFINGEFVNDYYMSKLME